MRLLIESLMIFFGTLMAAALVALGVPGDMAFDSMNSVTSPRPVEVQNFRSNPLTKGWSATVDAMASR